MLRKSYAKINLALNVTNKNKPDKMHSLDMVNFTISLYDKISIRFIENKKSSTIITCNNANVPTDKNNLVYKVVEQYRNLFKKDFSCIIHIIKNIPLESGMGGGSSNAAVVLKMLDYHYETDMTVIQKSKFMENITSDGPYFIVSPYASRIRGTGNILDPIYCNFKYQVALVKPRSGCSTKEVYGNLDYKNLVHPNINKIIDSIEKNDFSGVQRHCGNSLQNSAMNINKDIKDILQRLECCGFEIVMLTGSGSTCFAISNKKLPYKHFKQLFNKDDYELVGIYNLFSKEK